MLPQVDRLSDLVDKPEEGSESEAQLISDIDPSYDADGIALVSFNANTVAAITATGQLRADFPGDLINVGKRPPLYPPDVTQISAPAGDEQPIIERGDYMYDNFVYFAYRYKYRDGETTALSPFSPAAFFPRDAEFNTDNLTIGNLLEAMVNSIGGVNIIYDVGNSEVTEVELIVTSSRNLNYYSIATINKADMGFPSSTPNAPIRRSFSFSDNKVYRTLPESEITRIFDGVPLRAQAQEFVGNRLVYGNYVQNYELRTVNANGPALVPDFTLGQGESGSRINNFTLTRSVKSDRNYEVGIVYLDREGRQTPVLVSENNTHQSSFCR